MKKIKNYIYLCLCMVVVISLSSCNLGGSSKSKDKDKDEKKSEKVDLDSEKQVKKAILGDWYFPDDDNIMICFKKGNSGYIKQLGGSERVDIIWDYSGKGHVLSISRSGDQLDLELIRITGSRMTLKGVNDEKVKTLHRDNDGDEDDD